MIEIKSIRHTDPLYPELLVLRNEVLRIPLGLSIYNDDLSKDETSTMIIAMDGKRIIGCVLLQPHAEEVVRLRAMAVADDHQGLGIGRKLVEAAEEEAGSLGIKKIILNARITAVGFYEKLGYDREGDIFKEVGIPHLLMYKAVV